MGYHSNFDLKVKATEYKDLQSIYEYLRERADDYYGLSSLFDSDRWADIGTTDDGEYELEVLGYDSVKWYSYHEDMQAVSREFPFALFILDIAGEEPGDLRRAFFVNGQFYEAEAQLPEFDMARLQ